MRKFIYTFSVIATLLTLSSCKKYLDINKNPNAATTVDPKLLFSYASVAYINLRSSGDMYIPMALAGQSVSAGGNNPTGWSGGDPSPDIYTFSSNFFNNSWVSLYVRGGANLQQAIRLSETASPVNNNAAAQCKVLLAMMVYDITTTFGDVPYTEAWNSDILYPHFDPQKTVLEGTLTLLDKALAQFDESSPLKIGANADGYDLFYKGDIPKWKKLAKSLKLRTLLTMVDADETKKAAIAALINDGTSFVGSAADNCLIPYQDVAGKRNPKYAISLQYNGGLNFFFATKPVTDIMDPATGGPAISDPRLPKFFDKPAGQTKYIGVVPGADAFDAINPRIAASLQSAAAPEVMYTYQEQLFNEAEIYARGLGVPVDLTTATARFRNGVEASCLYFGVPAAAAKSYADQFNTVFANQAVAIQTIHAQQWVDKMDRGLDAFTQWRRSGPEGSEVPVLTLPIGAPAGPIFRRFEYPITNELSRNPNAPATIKYNVKMWFDL
ncbi:MAG: SusD/RagB family nutrient-binding outer membrane lipoprotein [Candidatus Pedobacter colombiensis]|uniref:SusD/RagB family nutrient-binding outer membrane lipoprotein n=1 Tax=Candidatus Pedobacter colombiensis TaxID=3121371 RepID=A0AAJ6B705_9SPHI|nr:SusD/RagB family nutrient-binding outer membrane lipoprotein [Pedobacter sp.]WEK19399.1 MAG: SusD/RagB family nutrient-binding outer membrane lipoprotein [Pedobacter sp.]